MPSRRSDLTERLVHLALRLRGSDPLRREEHVRVSFARHVAASGPVVRAGVLVALVLDSALPQGFSRLGPVAAVRRLLASSMELHREPPGSQGESVRRRPVRSGSPRGGGRRTGDGIFDEIVIGSGPGGAIAAHRAAMDGRRVAILEVGSLPSNSESHSTEQLLSDFRDAGQELILGRPIVPFAQGMVLGGGSEVNSGLYHRLPEHLTAGWLSAIGSTPAEWRQAEREVEDLLPVRRQDAASLGVYADSPIPRIADHLGWRHDVIPRWRTYTDAGHVHHGMVDTYLRLAVEADATVLSGIRADRIDVGSDSVTVRTDGGEMSARRVVVAAGTTGTPGILARSGLISLRRTSFGYHAMAKIAVAFPSVINDLVDIDPHQAWEVGGTAKLGVAASTPDLLRSALAGLGLSPEAVSGHLGVYYVSLPAAGSGGIATLGRHTQPWFITDAAFRQRLRALVSDLEGGVVAAGGEVLAPGRYSVSTVHVFGSLPIGASELVNADGVVFGSGGRVRVSDASLLPTAPAVNPQGPLMHLATVLARRAVSSC